jgi:hypothetical protein
MDTHQPGAPRRASIVAFAVILICIGTTGRAAEPAPPSAPFSVNLLDISPPASSGQPVSRNTSVRLRGWGTYSWASGSMSIGNQIAGVQHNIDLETTLGMDLDDFSGGALLGFNLGAQKRLHVDFSYEGYYNYKGNKDVGSISFNGDVFTGRVKSSLELQEGAMVLGYDIWRSDDTGLTITPTLGLRLFYLDARIGEEASPLRDSSTLWVPIPDLGLAVRWDITPNIYVRGSAEGIWLGELASYGNFTAEAGYDFNQNVGVFVGYRYWLFRVDYEDDEFRFDTNSVYAGVEFRM